MASKILMAILALLFVGASLLFFSSHAHQPLCLCFLLHSALFALHFTTKRQSPASLQPQAITSTLSSHQLPFLFNALADLHLCILHFLNAAAAANLQSHSSHHGGFAAAASTVEGEEMSLDQLHLRIESYIARVRSNMRREAKSEWGTGGAEQSMHAPSTHIRINSGRIQFSKTQGRIRCMVVHLKKGND
ncbi:hypothetical protein L7F22_033305 [Adiantum nelumboides]|nr:hypothetical protein [Adiantum nelumboides]